MNRAFFALLLATIVSVPTVQAQSSGAASQPPGLARRNTVFIGGLISFDNLRLPGVTAPLLATGCIGLYEHGVMMQFADRPASRAGSPPWPYPKPYPYAPDGTVPAILAQFHSAGELAELGCCSLDFVSATGEWKQDYTSQGAVPHAANWDLPAPLNGSAALDDTQVPAAELQFDRANAAGLSSNAPYITPDQDLVHTSFDDPYWANAKAVALYGRGIALDAPPAYALSREEAYRQFVVAALRWAAAHSLRSSLSLDTYGQASGFLTDTQDWLNYLRAHGVAPTEYVVQSFNQVGVQIEPDYRNPDSINSVALWVARNGLTASGPGGALQPCRPAGPGHG
ncbi:MAG: hypothetical protein JO264_19875 [Acidisphaera sp.]|nr:hypothetical protein [Acidisphaera sp.]